MGWIWRAERNRCVRLLALQCADNFRSILRLIHAGHVGFLRKVPAEASLMITRSRGYFRMREGAVPTPKRWKNRPRGGFSQGQGCDLDLDLVTSSWEVPLGDFGMLTHPDVAHAHVWRGHHTHCCGSSPQHLIVRTILRFIVEFYSAHLWELGGREQMSGSAELYCTRKPLPRKWREKKESSTLCVTQKEPPCFHLGHPGYRIF